jgi:hypothetical protein
VSGIETEVFLRSSVDETARCTFVSLLALRVARLQRHARAP